MMTNHLKPKPEYKWSRLAEGRLEARRKYAWRFECMACGEMVYVFGHSDAQVQPGDCGLCYAIKHNPLVIRNMSDMTMGGHSRRPRVPEAIKFSEELWAVVALDTRTGDELMHCIYLTEHGQSMREP